MREEQERLRKLLHDTVTMLCRNSLPYEHSVCIKGVIGVTVDDSDVFLVHINNTVTSSQDTAPRDTEYPQSIKSECQYTESSTLEPMMRGFCQPYNSSATEAAAAAAAGNEHISSTVVTKSDDMWADSYEESYVYEDSYNDPVNSLMDVYHNMTSTNSYQQPMPVVQHRSRPRMPVCAFVLS